MRIKKKLNRIKEEIEHRQAIEPYYFEEMTPLRHPYQQKYLHPAISEKIAAAIHERISRK